MLPRKRVELRARGIRELRLEVGEDAKLGVVGVSDVQVVLVMAAPEERGAALDPLDVRGVDPARAQEPGVLVGEVVADRADHMDVAEEARRKREVDRRAAQHALALAERRANAVERDAPDYCQRHEGGSLSSVE